MIPTATPREPTAPPEAGPYRGCRIAVGTAHGKALALGPPFAQILGARLVTPVGLDTDRFGTFSGETPRPRSASETARAKARLGMRAARLPYGLASEASYGPLPGIGLPGHEEILVFLDDVLGIEVVEGYRTMQTPGTAHRVTEAADLPTHLLDGLGEQALVVRPSTGDTAADIVKGITAVGDLDAAIRQAARRSPDGTALVEPDLRAHHNPSRRVVLGRLAQTLARAAARCATREGQLSRDRSLRNRRIPSIFSGSDAAGPE